MNETVSGVTMGVAAALGDQVGGCLIEGDAFHPVPDLAAVRVGIQPGDADRAGWIERLVVELNRACLACPAFKRSYRDRLRNAIPMPTSLVASPFTDLEPPVAESLTFTDIIRSAGRRQSARVPIDFGVAA
ncbi:hypothetical protein [Burkholderia stagnalis]|nr:hypothetical protein [Burkholderia stagnalis]